MFTAVPNSFKGWSVEENLIGRSKANVFKFSKWGCLPLFAKTVTLDDQVAVQEAYDEVSRLRWLGNQAILCARIHDVFEHEDCLWVVTQALDGTDLAQHNMPPARKVEHMANALTHLHRIDPNSCPFKETLDVKLENARRNVWQKRVDETDFEPIHLGKTAVELLDMAQKQCPTQKDVVVTHGDACLPNFIASETAFSGFVDCGRLGVSDRYQDIALAARSIHSNLGGEWVPLFFDAYGLTTPDQTRLSYFTLLDELF